MKHYILTSSKFEGSVTFKYDESGYLVSYEYNAEMSEDMRVYMLRRLPLTEDSFQYMIRDSKSAKVEEVPEDLSFDAFWNAYNFKHNRKRCEPLWKKMSMEDKMLCLKSIVAYNRYLKRNSWLNKKHPDGYLSNQYYHTPWDKMN